MARKKKPLLLPRLPRLLLLLLPLTWLLQLPMPLLLLLTPLPLLLTPLLLLPTLLLLLLLLATTNPGQPGLKNRSSDRFFFACGPSIHIAANAFHRFLNPFQIRGIGKAHVASCLKIAKIRARRDGHARLIQQIPAEGGAVQGHALR